VDTITQEEIALLPGMLPPREKQIKILERLGESEVRYLLTDFSHHDFDPRVAEEWLRQKEDLRVAVSSAKRDEREEETLKIAKSAAEAAAEAARFASEQARWARWAVIIAVIAAMIATKDDIFKFIVWVFS